MRFKPKNYSELEYSDRRRQKLITKQRMRREAAELLGKDPNTIPDLVVEAGYDEFGLKTRRARRVPSVSRPQRPRTLNMPLQSVYPLIKAAPPVDGDSLDATSSPPLHGHGRHGSDFDFAVATNFELHDSRISSRGTRMPLWLLPDEIAGKTPQPIIPKFQNLGNRLDQKTTQVVGVRPAVEVARPMQVGAGKVRTPISLSQVYTRGAAAVPRTYWRLAWVYPTWVYPAWRIRLHQLWKPQMPPKLGTAKFPFKTGPKNPKGVEKREKISVEDPIPLAECRVSGRSQPQTQTSQPATGAHGRRQNGRRRAGYTHRGRKKRGKNPCARS